MLSDDLEEWDEGDVWEAQERRDIYIYIYIYVCVCRCVFECENEFMHGCRFIYVLGHEPGQAYGLSFEEP